jgi:nucleoside-diphosphate-sugar epimerase
MQCGWHASCYGGCCCFELQEGEQSFCFPYFALRFGPQKKVVYASSSGVVGCSLDSTFCATEDSPYCEEIAAHWPYYRGKIEAERDAISYAENYGVELMCMRPSMMWGPGDDRFRCTKLVKWADLIQPVVCSSFG